VQTLPASPALESILDRAHLSSALMTVAETFIFAFPRVLADSGKSSRPAAVRNGMPSRVDLPARALVASTIFHLALALFLIRVPPSLDRLAARIHSTDDDARAKILYHLTPIHFTRRPSAMYLSGPILVHGTPWWDRRKSYPRVHRPASASRWHALAKRSGIILERPDARENANQILWQSAVRDDRKLNRDVPAPNVAAGEATDFRKGHPMIPVRATDASRDLPLRHIPFSATRAEVGLLAFSEHPAPFEAMLVLPAGDREAQFASELGETGAPRSVETSSSDASVTLDESNATATGAAGQKPATGSPSAADSVIYAVSASSLVGKRISVVVEAGPAGGGGLDVYGILRCDQIYTIDLAMPGNPWVLEYCDPGASASGAAGNLRAPVAEVRFDFRPTGLPAEASETMIVLHGWIQADGSVVVKEIIRGATPATDASAERTFSRWKFLPATRNGSPVRVEVLVGIPANGNP
jgi:hypothetical protein